MKNKLATFVLIAIIVTGSFSAVGEGLFGGYRFIKSNAIIGVAQDFGIDVSNTNAITAEIYPYIVANDFLRVGGTLSLSFFRVNGVPRPDALPFDSSRTSAGVGFGDANLGLLAELYYPCLKWDRAIGIATGYGAVITFIEDLNCSNDGEAAFYWFLKPQVSAAYSLGGSVALELAAGYKFIFPIDETAMWHFNADYDSVFHRFDADEMEGIFIKAGIVIGSLDNKDSRTYRPRKWFFEPQRRLGEYD